MLNRFITLWAAFLFTGFAAFSQETSEKIVALHLSDNTELVHFEQNGYILSFDRNDLLAGFQSCDCLGECTALLTVSDTLDLTALKEEMRAIALRHETHSRTFERAMGTSLQNGNVRIHSTASGKDLAQLKIIKDKEHTDRITSAWTYEDPLTGKEIYDVPRIRIITPSF